MTRISATAFLCFKMKGRALGLFPTIFTGTIFCSTPPVSSFLTDWKATSSLPCVALNDESNHFNLVPDFIF